MSAALVGLTFGALAGGPGLGLPLLMAVACGCGRAAVIPLARRPR